jgi:hypothetical protein
MPTYPSDLNGPNLTMNNLTNREELVDIVATGGVPITGAHSDTYANTALALNNLLVDIFSAKSQIVGTKDISDPAGLDATENANITEAEEAYLAAAFALEFRNVQAQAMELSRLIIDLKAKINTGVGGAASQAPAGTAKRYPTELGSTW